MTGQRTEKSLVFCSGIPDNNRPLSSQLPVLRLPEVVISTPGGTISRLPGLLGHCHEVGTSCLNLTRVHYSRRLKASPTRQSVPLPPWACFFTGSRE